MRIPFSYTLILSSALAQILYNICTRSMMGSGLAGFAETCFRWPKGPIPPYRNPRTYKR